MKYLPSLLCLLLALPVCQAQQKPVTIVLLRHAEKAASLNTANPPLSAAGKARARRLPLHLKSVCPDAFYSTNTTRTRETIQPWADEQRKPILIYDAAKQNALADSLKRQSGKTFVVVGHSNTIPAFVNQLTGTTHYPDLPDTVYGRIWIVTFSKGKARVKEDRY